MSLSPLERRVCEAISRRGESMLDDLRLHVGLATGGRNLAALDESRRVLTDRARTIGASVELAPGDLKPDWLHGQHAGLEPLPTAICRRAAGPGCRGREVLLAGHLDTVHDPSGPFRDLAVAPDGRTALGPGCVDMKGGLVIALAALEALHECGHDGAWTLLLNSDEETGSYHSHRAIADEAKRVARGDGVGIALEPATPEGGLVVARAGSGQFMIECRGRAAHVGRDFASGVSAVSALAACVLAAQRLSEPSRQIIVNIGPLEGGIATNVVPDRARAWGNVRFPTPEAAADVLASLNALESLDVGPAKVSVRTSFNRPAKPMTEGTRRLAELARACAEEMGQSLPFSTTAGVCDGNVMQAAGLSTIDTLGVRGGGLHTLDEWIDLSSMVQRCQLLALVIMRVGAA